MTQRCLLPLVAAVLLCLQQLAAAAAANTTTSEFGVLRLAPLPALNATKFRIQLLKAVATITPDSPAADDFVNALRVAGLMAVLPVAAPQLLCLAACGDAGCPHPVNPLSPVDAYLCLAKFIENSRRYPPRFGPLLLAPRTATTAPTTAAGRKLQATATTAATTSVIGADLPVLPASGVNFTAVLAKLKSWDDRKLAGFANASSSTSGKPNGLDALSRALAAAAQEARAELVGVETAAKLALLAPAAVTFAGVPLLCLAAYGFDDAMPAKITPLTAAKCMTKVLSRMSALH